MTGLLNGKYTLDVCIGRGGMAEVFAGRIVGTEGFSQRIAIKRIHPVHSLDPAFRRMFVTEAQLSSQLLHPNIVRVFDFDEDEAGCLYLVMDYVDGIDLDGLISTGLLPLPLVLFVTGEILRGLAHVHELPLVEGGPRGLVHRDVSPQNVLLSWNGAVQISDFGIAKARTATMAGASILIKGKPAYMSPEQVGGLALDGRSDVFAVGIMLWEMLCGEPLFNDPDDMRATLAAVMFGDAPAPSTRSRRPIPDDVERVTMQLLRRDREERHDAATALDALTACADYPRCGQRALAALLPERFPGRAPRRSLPRLPRPAPPWEQVTLQAPADAAPGATAIPIAVPQIRYDAPIRDQGSILGRSRRRGLRGVLLGAIMMGALIGVMLHVVFRGNSRSDTLEHASPTAMPRAEPAPAPGLGLADATPQLIRVDAPRPPRVDAPQPTTGAALHETPARTRRGDASRVAPSTRAPAPAPVRRPAKGGMQIIDLHQKAPANGMEIDLGPASE
jgi:serine/threonine protein kinase